MSTKINYELTHQTNYPAQEQKNNLISTPKTQTPSTQSTLSEPTAGKELHLLSREKSENPSFMQRFISAFIRLFSW